MGEVEEESATVRDAPYHQQVDTGITCMFSESINVFLIDQRLSAKSAILEDERGAWQDLCGFSSLWHIFSRKARYYWILLLLSSSSMMIAFPASSILSRLYYVDGGTRRWLLSWVAAAGWPLTALILLPMYFTKGVSPTAFTWQLFMSYVVLGALSAADNLMFAWSYAYLPASTSSLLSSSSLTFTAIFAYLIVGKKWNASILNAIAVMTAGAILLGLDADSDRPKNTTSGQYAIGFLLDILGSALHGLIFALSELMFIKILGRKSFHVVLEVQVYTSLFACIITAIGTIINGDFTAMRLEAQRFHHGPAVYYMVLIWAAICFQLGVLGGVAVLYLTSTLFAGVLNAAKVPVTALAAVVCFNDSMTGFKIMSLLLTLWGFGSYIYGGVQAHASPDKNKSESLEFAPEQQPLSVPLVVQKFTPA